MYKGNGYSFTSYNEELGDFEIESLATRREDRFHKFAEGLADIEQTKDLLPPPGPRVIPAIFAMIFPISFQDFAF